MPAYSLCGEVQCCSSVFQLDYSDGHAGTSTWALLMSTTAIEVHCTAILTRRTKTSKTKSSLMYKATLLVADDCDDNGLNLRIHKDDWRETISYKGPHQRHRAAVESRHHSIATHQSNKTMKAALGLTVTKASLPEDVREVLYPNPHRRHSDAGQVHGRFDSDEDDDDDDVDGFFKDPGTHRKMPSSRSNTVLGSARHLFGKMTRRLSLTNGKRRVSPTSSAPESLPHPSNGNGVDVAKERALTKERQRMRYTQEVLSRRRRQYVVNNAGEVRRVSK